MVEAPENVEQRMNQWRYSVAMQKITASDARHDRGEQSEWAPSEG